MSTQGEVTQLLEDLNRGDREAYEKLVPLVYEQLHALAEDQLRRERPSHTLQPTALVREAFLRLVDQKKTYWKNRAHFFAVAAQIIRRILVDHARSRGRAKRGGDRGKVLLDEALVSAYERNLDLLALDEALEKLERTAPQQAKVIQMRFFAGLTIRETAAVLGVSSTTVEREWRYARAWLFQRLGHNDSRFAEENDDGGGEERPT